MKIGVLAVQGNFREHAAMLRRLGADAVEVVERFRFAHLDRVGPQPPQHRCVLAKVSLHCQDADLHDVDCRFGRWPGR